MSFKYPQFSLIPAPTNEGRQISLEDNTVSKTVTVGTAMTDLGCVYDALKELGINPVVNAQKTVVTVTIPEIAKRSYIWADTMSFELKKGKVIINGDDMILQDMDRNGRMNEFKRTYTRVKLQKQAKAKGFQVKWKSNKDGTISMVAKKQELIRGT